MDDPGRVHYARAIRQFQRYQTDWNVNDLDSAIDAGKLAVQATPEGHPDRTARCSDLGAMFAQRYQLMEDLEDLDEAIRLESSSVASLLAGNPHQPAFSNNLGSYFRMRYDRTGELSDLNEALIITQLAGRVGLTVNFAGSTDQAGLQFDQDYNEISDSDEIGRAHV